MKEKKNQSFILLYFFKLGEGVLGGKALNKLPTRSHFLDPWTPLDFLPCDKLKKSLQSDEIQY